MNALVFSSIAQHFVERLPACMLGGMAVALLAWMLLRVWRRQGSGTRYIVWLSALMASALFLIPHPAAPAEAYVTEQLHDAVVLPSAWAGYIFIAWIVGALFAVVRLGFALWHLRQLRESSHQVDAITLPPELREILTSASSRQISIRVSDRVTVPTAIGIFSPAILIPVDIWRESPADALRQVLLHEIAHLERWDDWTNLAQRLVSAVLFFHPATWWIDRQLAAEREMACDDFVIHHTGDSKAYARCLAALAERSFARHSTALVHAAVSRARQTSERVARLLQIQSPVATRIWRPAISLVGLIGIAAVGIESYTPNLISFQEPTHPTVAAAEVPILKPTGTFHPVMAKFVPRKSANLATRASAATEIETAKVSRNSLTKNNPAVAVLKTAPKNNQERVVQAKFNNRQTLDPHNAVAVERAVFFVMRDDGSEVPTVTFFQMTVWHVPAAQHSSAAISTHHKST